MFTNKNGVEFVNNGILTNKKSKFWKEALKPDCHQKSQRF